MNQITEASNLASLSTLELKNELSRGLEITSRHLVYLAKIWRELENRGEDLSDIRHGMLSYLPLIANEQVEPGLVVNYAGQKTLLAALTSLPIEVQRQISETGYVDMASDDGRVVQVQVSRLRAADVYRVFDMQAQRVRPVAEQAKLIMETARRRPLPPVTNIVAFEQRDGDDLLVISGKRVKVVRVLSELMNRYPAFTQEFADVIDKIKKH
ncbi:hypothetical protein GUO57_004332 [Salmonella enterica]|uniref:hypothetical protein n=1 Tax=Salmonella enterica TaxID=28901 RepID=UPI0009AD1AC4|nr:hypothetical protein [Salmonella enterica]ECI0026453.1 hypothetical protein [Salmonella enterica subsp. enterica serovar Litchfield]ECV5716227.1 hypothetical protein [Salmonella enterica subsp. enterica serovar Oranienburg]EEA7036143.1 hypothetical protein [Salmonella enterica subsp. enterica serovar Newport]EAU5748051.1 hypothetical protein [Salmonella enterica]EBA6646473.1 hypothetical protein [Salmonella enterica]